MLSHKLSHIHLQAFYHLRHRTGEVFNATFAPKYVALLKIDASNINSILDLTGDACQIRYCSDYSNATWKSIFATTTFCTTWDVKVIL